jgi:hypothetical protein
VNEHAGGLVNAVQRTVRLVGGIDCQTSELMGGEIWVNPEPPPPFRTPLVAPSYRPTGEDWMPAWVRAHVERGAPAAEIVADALGRTLRTPDRATLLEAQMVLNELGPDPDNAVHVREAVREASRLLLGSGGRS